MNTLGEELLEIADRLSAYGASDSDVAIVGPLETVGKVLESFNRCFGGSWLGYHANVYYEGFQDPPPGAHFSVEWGLMRLYTTGSTGRWQEFSDQSVREAIWNRVGSIDLDATRAASADAKNVFNELKSQVQVALAAARAGQPDQFIEKLDEEVGNTQALSEAQIMQRMKPSQTFSRDSTAVGQGFQVPPHAKVFAEMSSLRQPFKACERLSGFARQAGSYLLRREKTAARSRLVGTNVFIGHGQASAWKDLRDFIRDRLRLPWDEFNRVPVAGVTNVARLGEMLDAASIAFLIMTGEDEQRGGKLVARMNVVHEAGLFQGRLGFQRAIILLEDGCEEFSNINGLGQIRFPKGNIGAKFEDVRLVLEREGLIGQN